MSSKYLKIGYWILWGVVVVICVHYIFFQMGSLGNKLDEINTLPTDIKVQELGLLAGSWTAWIMDFTGIMILIGAIVAIGMSLYQMAINAFQNKKSRKPLIFGLLGSIVIIVGCYLAAVMTTKQVPVIVGIDNIELTTVVRIEAGLFLTYTISVLTFFILIYGEVSKLWK